jgi:hypothetical protein
VNFKALAIDRVNARRIAIDDQVYRLHWFLAGCVRVNISKRTAMRNTLLLEVDSTLLSNDRSGIVIYGF